MKRILICILAMLLSMTMDGMVNLPAQAERNTPESEPGVLLIYSKTEEESSGSTPEPEEEVSGNTPEPEQQETRNTPEPETAQDPEPEEGVLRIYSKTEKETSRNTPEPEEEASGSTPESEQQETQNTPEPEAAQNPEPEESVLRIYSETEKETSPNTSVDEPGVLRISSGSEKESSENTLRPGEKTVTLTFAGDVTLGGEELSRRGYNSFDSVAEREGYGYFFRNVKELFSQDDLTLVNLEGVLSDSSLLEDTSKTFRFRGSADFARILTESSIEACAISNNHIMDYGTPGYDATREALEAHGVLYCGNEYSFILEKDGIRIGFFALGNKFFDKYADQVAKEIARMRKDGVNAIVCSFHAGQEYLAHHRQRDQAAHALTAIEEWGADLVIMHHPHVVQGVDLINGRYVFYSLGNFCFGGNLYIRSREDNLSVRTLESMAVQMTLRFDADGTYLGQEGRIYPCYSSSTATRAGQLNNFQPKLVTGDEAAGVLRRIQKDTSFKLGPLEAGGYVSLPYQEAAGAKQ